jgi:hypothetical protein
MRVRVHSTSWPRSYSRFDTRGGRTLGEHAVELFHRGPRAHSGYSALAGLTEVEWRGLCLVGHGRHACVAGSRQEGELILVSTLTHGLSEKEGGYHWSGELRLWDNEILMGWYASTEGANRDKGTMYFVLHPHGLSMAGRWVGLSNDGKIMTVRGSMAKERDDAEAVIARLNQEHGGVEVR